MNDNKFLYEKLCNECSSVPIFSQGWWLDVVAGSDNWDVALVKNKNEEIIATMPYTLQKKFGFRISIMPKLTQVLGPWVKPFNGSYTKQLGYDKDNMQALIQQLPKLHVFDQAWNYAYTNWLPFYWQGFKQTTRYTYTLDDLSNLDAIYKGFQSKIKGDIKKAQNRFNLQVKDDLSIDDFIALNKLVFSRQGMKLPYSDDFIRSLDQACLQRGCRKLLIAVDENGKHHAGVYIIWDSQSAYYLLGGADPELRNSGATSLCLWEGIQFAATVTKGFDFEGSMLEPVERFVRGFGAIQKPYHVVNKTSSPWVELLMYLYKNYRVR